MPYLLTISISNIENITALGENRTDRDVSAPARNVLHEQGMMQVRHDHQCFADVNARIILSGVMGGLILAPIAL